MGVLTGSTGKAASWFSRLMEHGRSIAVGLYVSGLLFLFVMPHPEFSHKTYFSENALLPGLVKGEFDEDYAATRYLEELREEAKRYSNSVPFPWLEAKLRQLGLEVYVHNFTLNYPLGASPASFSGRNVYAILRALRSSSTEALVLSAPFRPPFSLEPGTDVAVALILASAKFFRTQNYWAKDIIFLFTEHEQLGMQAWLEAYHQTSCGFSLWNWGVAGNAGKPVLEYGELEAKAGAIQAAVNLEIEESRITHVNVKIEGLNGQLPNLDLVNLIHRLSMREGVGQLFQKRHDPNFNQANQYLYGGLPAVEWKPYKSALQTLVGMMLRQATGVPSGNHGLFHRFGIEAITLEGVRVPRGAKKQRQKQQQQLHEADLFVMGRIVEGTFRSLNNLLERFHQSFFFYLLPGTSRYVSIGMYMPGFGLLAGSLVLCSLSIWHGSHLNKVAKSDDEKRSDPADGKNQDGGGVDSGDGGKPSVSGDVCVLPEAPLPDVAGVLPVFLFSHLMGATLMHLPSPLSVIGNRHLALETDDAVFLGIVTFAGAGALMPLLAPAAAWSAFSLKREGSWKVAKCLVLLETAALAFTVALCNFSLAYIVTATLAPIALMVEPAPGAPFFRPQVTTPDNSETDQVDAAARGRWRPWLKWALRSVCLLLVNPVVLLYLACALDTFRSFPENSISQLWSGSWEATKRALVFSVTDSYVYGNVNFILACLFLLPCWNIFWTLNNSQVAADP